MNVKNNNMEKMINYDDAIAARYVEGIKGWVDINNMFYGDNPESEHMARYSSCTHTKCKTCGKDVVKGWIRCDECIEKDTIEKYNNLPFEVYNGEIVYSYMANMFFQDSDEIADYCYDNDINSSELLLVFCKENKYRHLDIDYWGDDLQGDDECDAPKELLDAIDNLNKLLDELPTPSYSPGKIRTLFR